FHLRSGREARYETEAGPSIRSQAALAPVTKSPSPDSSVGAVLAEVARRNEEGRAERARFEAAGWTIRTTAPPESRLLALDPTLLRDREEALRLQIESTTARASDVENLRTIALRAATPGTQLAAIDALARLGTVDAQAAMLDLLDRGDGPIRHAVVG